MDCGERAFGRWDLFGRCHCRLHALKRAVNKVIDERHPTDIDAVHEIVGEMFTVLDDVAPSTRHELLKHFNRFVGWCRSVDIRDIRDVGPEEVATFIYLPVLSRIGVRKPAFATCRNRRLALRRAFMVLRTLGYVMPDPTIDVVLPSKVDEKARACSDSEIARLRRSLQADLAGTPYPCILALAEAGATNGEIAAATASAIDLESGTVVLRGNRRTRPRVNHLTDWGLAILAQRVGELAPDQLIVQNAEGEDASTSVVSQYFSLIVSFARVYGQRLSIDSVRYWGARRVYDATGRVEDAAYFLGNVSLNTTAAGIGLDWRAAD